MDIHERPRLKIIESDKEYQEALEAIKDLMDLGISDENEDYMEVLSLVIEKYEEEKGYKLDDEKVDAIDMIAYYLSEQGLPQKSLIPILGPASRVSEIMNKKRKLSLSQIENLHSHLNIPYELLMKR
ncbi:transcriptional regulator [Aquiflexum sp. TKW24L]|uniref:helix-turn-helix domain-containing protein n=1 Tax=Aquiflexum sp. TKW24L TaxID=2942212 RepID=UPI0020BD842D|nr:transcriptional regulator [Aquiflexum sp. TKW24L]MCL6258268.1 transcriptional regulator [Aquiflexum sp. TKW24L]